MVCCHQSVGRNPAGQHDIERRPLLTKQKHFEGGLDTGNQGGGGVLISISGRTRRQAEFKPSRRETHQLAKLAYSENVCSVGQFMAEAHWFRAAAVPHFDDA